MFTAIWDVNGKHIVLEAEYMGDMPAPFDPGNYGHNIITVEVDGRSDTFDAWGSRVRPEFADEYSLKNIFQLICDEALMVVWDQLDEMVDMCDDPKEALRVVDGARAEAEKIAALGIDEETLEMIVNDDEWH